MVFSTQDKRKETAFWPLIATLEGEIKDTPWWRIIRQLTLRRKLDVTKQWAFSHGMRLAMDDLEKMGVVKRNPPNSK